MDRIEDHVSLLQSLALYLTEAVEDALDAIERQAGTDHADVPDRVRGILEQAQLIEDEASSLASALLAYERE